MTLTPLMVFTLVTGIPLLAISLACYYFDDADDDDLDSSKYVKVSLHPLTSIALVFILGGGVGYITWLLTHSPVITTALGSSTPLLAAYIYAEFFAERADETESKKGKSEKKKSKDRRQHQPAPTLRSHPPSVTTNRPRRAHRARVASAAKGR